MIRFSRKGVLWGMGLALSLVTSMSLAANAIYADLSGGGYVRNVKDDSVIGSQVRGLGKPDWSHGRFGWQFGADVGYRFWSIVSAEFGWSWLQAQKVSFGASGFTLGGHNFVQGSSISFNSWLLYLAAKVATDIDIDTQIYAKLGVAYERNKVEYELTSGSNNPGTYTGDGNLWSPMLAVGVSYRVTKHWLVSMDYMVLLGNSIVDDPYYSTTDLTDTRVHLPTLQRFSVSVGYEFDL